MPALIALGSLSHDLTTMPKSGILLDKHIKQSAKTFLLLL